MNQRRAQMVLAMVFAVHGTVSGNFATRVPWIQQHLGLGAGQIGMALLCVALGSFLAVPLTSRLIARFGARAVVRVGLPAVAIGIALPALAPGFIALCGVLLAFGVFVGAADAGMKQQAIAVERQLPHRIMSRLHGLWSIGTLAGAGIGTAATFGELDARIHLGALGVVLLAIVIGLGFVLPHTQTPPPATPSAQVTRRRLPSPAIILLIVIGFCAAFAEAAAHNWSSVLITELPGGSSGTASIGFAVFVAAMATGRLCGDRLISRFGPVTVVRVGGLAAVAGSLSILTSSAPITAMAGFALIGLGLATIVPVVVTAASNIGGSGVSAVIMSTYLANLSSPGIIGGIADKATLTGAFALIAGIMVAAVCLAGALRPTEAAGTVIARLPRLRGAVRTSFTKVARSTPVMVLTLGRAGRARPVTVTIGEPAVATAPVSLSFPTQQEWSAEAFTTGDTVIEQGEYCEVPAPSDDSPTIEIPALKRHTDLAAIG